MEEGATCELAGLGVADGEMADGRCYGGDAARDGGEDGADCGFATVDVEL